MNTADGAGAQRSLLDGALAYSRLGIHVLPLHSPGPSPSGCDCRRDCGKNAAKHPRTLHGLSDATLDEATIRYWWGMWPHANVGGATGPVSRLLAIDIDPRHKGDETLKALLARHGQFPPTWRARTAGGGWHLYFRYPEGLTIRNSAGSVLGAGLDVRGAGGSVVLPPSVGANREPYAWEVDPWS